MSYEAGNIRTISLNGLGRTQRQRDIQRALATSSSPLLRKAAGFTKPGPFISPKSIAPLAIIAGTAATFLIPGAAPLVAKGLTAGAGLLKTGIVKGSQFIARQVVPVRPTPASFFGPPAPTPGPSVPSEPFIPSGPSVASSGGGGGDFIGPPAQASMVPAEPAAPGETAPAPKGLNPVAVVGILAALLLAFSPKGVRR